MSISSFKGEVKSLVPDVVGTPNVPDGSYEVAQAKDYAGTKIYSTYVPLCESSKSEFHKAVCDRDNVKVKALLEQGTDTIDQQDFLGDTALHCSTISGHTGTMRGRHDEERTDCARMLIEAGANVNVAGQWGHTPLHLAALGNIEAIKMLIKAKADITLTDSYGGNPLHVAAKGKPEALQILLSHPDVAEAQLMKNKQGETPLDTAKEFLKTTPFTVQADRCISLLTVGLKSWSVIPSIQDVKEEVETGN